MNKMANGLMHNADIMKPQLKLWASKRGAAALLGNTLWNVTPHYAKALPNLALCMFSFGCFKFISFCNNKTVILSIALPLYSELF